MGHSVQAFVGRRQTLEAIQREFSVSQVVDLQQGLTLLPLLDDLFDAIPAEDLGSPVENFKFLTQKIVGLTMRFSTGHPLGYFETNYFGGTGGQGAILATKGKIAFGPQWGIDSINKMLVLMGVEKCDADEFASLGLGRFRRNEDWIEQPHFGRLSAKTTEKRSFFSKLLNRRKG